MKKFALIVTLILGASVASWAGSACCAAGKSKAKSKTYDTACTRPLASLQLTEEQKAKIAEIEAACKAQGCSKEMCEKSRSQIRELLTAEQRGVYDEQLSKIAN